MSTPVVAAAAAPAAKPNVVFVLGGPGAGKGTQCGRICEKYGWVHLSAGDLLRAERKSGSENATLINEYIKEGKIVPVLITVTLLKTAIMKAMREDGKSYFLVDGFPRNQDNLDGWLEVMGDSCTQCGVLFFDCPEAVMEARLLERGKTSGRSDDNLASIKKRFATFQNESMPVVNHFSSLNIVHRIVADRSLDEVWVDVQAAVAKLMAVGTAATAAAGLDDTKNYKAAFHKAMRKAIIAYWAKQPAAAVAAATTPAAAPPAAAGADAAAAATDTAATAATKKQTQQYWHIPDGDKFKLCVSVIKEVLFDPSRDGVGKGECEWSCVADSKWAGSGGTTVTATDTRTVTAPTPTPAADGTTPAAAPDTVTKTTHTAYINYYGVLESFATPSIPSSMRPVDDGGAGCVMM